MKKYLIFLVTVMIFAAALPAFAADQNIYLKGTGSDFKDTWKNTFKVTDEVGEYPNVWHLVYPNGNIKNVKSMQLDFGENGLWNWTPDMGFSTNNGGNNQGWVVIAPYDWKLYYVDKGNNNTSNSFVVTSDSEVNFNVSGFHRGSPDDPEDPKDPKDPEDPETPHGELNIKKNVDGTFIGEWFANLPGEDVLELIASTFFKVYAVDFDGEERFTEENLAGTGELEPDGLITFTNFVTNSNMFPTGWYAIVEELEGLAADVFVNEDGKVGPLFFYIDTFGVTSEISEPNLDGKFRIQHTPGWARDVKMIFEDNEFTGYKPDGSGQQLSTERFDAVCPDGTLLPSFCADLGAHQVFGNYVFDDKFRNMDPELRHYLIAALDYVNDMGSVEDDYSCKALAQVILWNVALVQTGDAGYAASWSEGNLLKIEGYGAWWDENDGYIKDVFEYVINNKDEIVAIYDAKLASSPTEKFVSGIVCIEGDGESYNPIDQQRQIVVLFSRGVVFNNKTNGDFEIEKNGSVTFTKMKIGGIVEDLAGENEFFFDLYNLVDGVWVKVNEESYPTALNGAVTIEDIKPGYYKVVEKKNATWTIEQKYANGIFFTIDRRGNATWDATGAEAPVVVNKPVLGSSYDSVTATNEGNRNAILAGLNPKNGNPLYDKKSPEDPTKSTPFVVPNSNHFVFAKMTRAELEAGVVLDMLVGNKYDLVGKALVKLEGGNIVITLNGVGSFGAIAFSKLPEFNNGNIHSQKEKDLAAFGAKTGFNHDSKAVTPCPDGNVVYLYIHCSSFQFYNEILAW